MTELKRVSTTTVRQMRDIYLEAFPRRERFSFKLLLKRFKQGKADFWCLMASGKPVGMAYILYEKRLAYLFYLAISSNERGHGYGTEAIEAIRKYYEGSRLFLAVETIDESAANYSQRVRRRDFYLRCGFSYLPCHIKEASVIFDAMSIGGSVSPDEYRALTHNWLGWPLRWIIDMRSWEQMA